MYYVYIYKDPRPTKNQQVVYVGKGTGDRDLSHWSRGSHNKPLQDFLSHLRQRDMEPIRQRVLETEDEQEAFKKEIELIALYGRRNIGTGTLFNLTDGGEGLSGAVKTAAHKENDKNNSLKNWADPVYREKVVAAQKRVQGTEEARSLKSEASKRTWADTAIRDKRTDGIKRSRKTELSKQKTRELAKAMWADPNYHAAQSANNKEIANREEVKAAKKAAAKALWADPVWRGKMMAARKKRIDSPSNN